MSEKPTYEELEKKFDDLENAMLLTGQDLMFRYSRDGKYLDYFAPNLGQLLVDLKFFLNRNLKEIMPTETAAKFLHYIQKTIDRGETQFFEYDLSFSKIDTRYYEARLTPTENNEVYAVVREITDHKTSQEKLYKSQKMLARTEQIAHLGSWEWEIATDEVTWSEELFRIFQRNPSDGMPNWIEHDKLYFPEDLEVLHQAIRIASVDGTPYELELRTIRKDGEIRVCDVKGFAELDENGKPVRLFGLLHDITERKQLERQIQVSQKMDSIGRLAGGIAHDFNNMLSVILGYLDFTLEKAKDDEDLYGT